MSANLSPKEHRWDLDDTDAQPRTRQHPVVVLVLSVATYRVADFVAAARMLRVDLIVASDGDIPVSDFGSSRSVTIDFHRPEWSAARLANVKPRPDAVVAADDHGVAVAALTAAMLSIPSNSVAAVSATREKAHMRGLLASSGVPQPRYRLAAPGRVAQEAAIIGYPCVVKPRTLAASRGVIRVNTTTEAEVAEERIRRIVQEAECDPEEMLLVEQFVPGAEVAVEGLLIDGELQVLAILDKPDALDGPFFEETIFVTPSRHPRALQEEIVSVVESATRALGLISGPVHGEVRCGPSGVVLIEIAARPIGGLCGRALTFGLLGESIESVILRSALGLPGAGLDRASAATGVFMVPIPVAGVLESIEGVQEALAVPGITDFSQTIPNGTSVLPLPEGDRYLAFLFAQGLSPEAAEHSLRTAHARLDVRISLS